MFQLQLFFCSIVTNGTALQLCRDTSLSQELHYCSQNTQVLFQLTEILWGRKNLLDVTGCRKTQVSDCTSSTVSGKLLSHVLFVTIEKIQLNGSLKLKMNSLVDISPTVKMNLVYCDQNWSQYFSIMSYIKFI